MAKKAHDAEYLEDDVDQALEEGHVKVVVAYPVEEDHMEVMSDPVRESNSVSVDSHSQDFAVEDEAYPHNVQVEDLGFVARVQVVGLYLMARCSAAEDQVVVLDFVVEEEFS